MAYRINVGCGTSPTVGENWKNYDNSFSVTLAKWPEFIIRILCKMRLFSSAHLDAIKRYRKHGNKILKAECTSLPLPDNSAEVVYTSHMLEHLSREKAEQFLKEAYRVLTPGGIIRIAVPDFDVRFNRLQNTQDTDTFISSLGITRPDLDTFSKKLRFLAIGDRSHKWMYNGKSLCKLLEKCGYVQTQALMAGETTIPNPSSIDLSERSEESAYAEAKKPAN